MTNKQLSAFWRLFGMACGIEGAITKAHKEDLRKKIMKEACNVDSIKKIGTGGDCDDLMYTTACYAHDYATAAHYKVGRAKCLSRMIEVCILQISQIKQLEATDVTSYIKGILKQSNHAICFLSRGDDWWLDITEDNLMFVFQCLDTHRRRTLNNLKWGGLFAFDINSQYSWQETLEGDIKLWLMFSTRKAIPLKIKVIAS